MAHRSHKDRMLYNTQTYDDDDDDDDQDYRQHVKTNSHNYNYNNGQDAEMIQFPPMFNCAANDDDDDRFTRDPSTSPYEFDMEDSGVLHPKGNTNPALNRTTSISTIETNGISLHETEHMLDDGTRVVRTETVDQAGFVLKVNETRTPPSATTTQKEGMFKKFPGNNNKSPSPEKKSSSPAAIAIFPRSSSPVRSSSPKKPTSPKFDEKKEPDTVHLKFEPSFDDAPEDEAAAATANGNDQETGIIQDPQNEKTDKKDDEDEDDDQICGLSKKIFCIILIILIFLIAAIVGGVVASSSSSSPTSTTTAEATAPSSSSDTTQPPTPPAVPTTNAPIQIIIVTPEPTMAPVIPDKVPPEVADLGGILLPNDNLETLSIFSPSYRALEWLLYKDKGSANLGISLEENSQDLRERFAIASLYFATNGKGWINSDQWMTPGVSVCNWEGVSCRSGNVTSLVFNANRLTGQLPTTLGELAFLEILNLPQNALEGTLCTELGKLTNLEIMNIYSNSIQGTVPTEMGRLQNMAELTLWFNDLNGNLPSELGRLTKLEKLDVAQNSFSDKIPTEFGNLQAVRKLFFDGNSFSGPLPSELGNLERLELLHVPNNRLSGTVPIELENAPNLLDLKLSANSFEGGLDNLFCGRTMTSFYADCGRASDGETTSLSCPCCTHCCGFGGCSEQTITLAPSIAPTSRLGIFADILIGPDKAKQNAILSNPFSPQYKALEWINDVDYPADDVIQDSASLQERYGLAVLYYATGGDTSWSSGSSTWLSPDLNQCQWEFIACIASQVRFLSLVNNNLMGTIPEEIAKISNLRSLEIRNNPMIPSKIPTEIGELRFLSNLSLEKLGLVGTIPTELMRLQFLTTLELAENDLTGNIPSRIQQLYNLKFLNVASNALDGGLPTELATLRLLRSVELQENSLSGSIPIEWGAQIVSPTPSIGLIPSFEFLEKLRLDQNKLTGNLPIQIGELKALREFHFHDNEFTGVLPTQLMDLPVLQYLRASSNQLRGTLHTYIGNLRKLSYFNVQENNFTGSIPTEFGSLTALTSLSLAFNPLEGEVPTTFTNLIRIDNIFLQGTNLVGGLESVLFCDRRLTLYFADCLVDSSNNNETEIACACCNYCCNAEGMECTPVQV